MRIRPPRPGDGPGLRHAARHRRMVELEVDDSHAHLWAVLAALPAVASVDDLVIVADG